jgi:hypothetical protein
MRRPASSLNIADDDWRMSAYGLRTKHGATIDVPILAVAFALVAKAEHSTTSRSS